MATNQNLEALLFRIRDGVATDAEVDAARTLVRTDVRLPDELREVIDFEEAESDAVGLLAVLGADSLFGEVLREGVEAELAGEPLEVAVDEVPEEHWLLHDDFVAAIAWEAGTVDVVASALQAVGMTEVAVPLAAAVRFEAGPIEVADAVLARCGLPSLALPLAEAIAGEAGTVDLVASIESELTDLRLPLAEAIAFEGGTVDIADAVVESVGGEARIPLAAAIRAEAGGVDVWPQLEAVVSDAWVSAMLDHELAPAAHRAAVRRLQESPEAGIAMTAFATLGSDLRQAVSEEAGECPYIWESVASELGIDAEHVEGWDGAEFAAAVRAEAGSVDLVDKVMQRVDLPSIPFSAVEVEAIPAPANAGGWSGSMVLMAFAAALLMVIAPFALNTSVDDTAPMPVASVVDSEELQFAAAGEIVVENLDYDENASVTQAVGDEGALILWVDEEATL